MRDGSGKFYMDLILLRWKEVFQPGYPIRDIRVQTHGARRNQIERHLYEPGIILSEI